MSCGINECNTLECNNTVKTTVWGTPFNNCEQCIDSFKTSDLFNPIYPCLSKDCMNETAEPYNSMDTTHETRNNYCYDCYTAFYMPEGRLVPYTGQLTCLFCDKRNPNTIKQHPESPMCCSKCYMDKTNNAHKCIKALDCFNVVDIEVIDFIKLAAVASDAIHSDPNKLLAFRQAIMNIISY